MYLSTRRTQFISEAVLATRLHDIQEHLHLILYDFFPATVSAPSRRRLLRSVSRPRSAPLRLPDRPNGDGYIQRHGRALVLSPSRQRHGGGGRIPAPARGVFPRNNTQSAARVFFFSLWLANYVTSTCSWSVPPQESLTFPFFLWQGAPRTRFLSRMRTPCFRRFSALPHADGLP